jgi:hypothetical protein
MTGSETFATFGIGLAATPNDDPELVEEPH